MSTARSAKKRDSDIVRRFRRITLALAAVVFCVSQAAHAAQPYSGKLVSGLKHDNKQIDSSSQHRDYHAWRGAKDEEGFLILGFMNLKQSDQTYVGYTSLREDEALRLRQTPHALARRTARHAVRGRGRAWELPLDACVER
jgi:hypothetical protein